jgi:RNA polymerase sigma-70 factor (ECF subfamily)
MALEQVRFEELIDRHHDEIYRYVWRMLDGAGRPDGDTQAQDLTQEVFLRAYRAYPRLRKDSNYRAWLYKIATHCAYDALRRQRRDADHRTSLRAVSEEIADEQGRSPYREAVLHETLGAVRAAIAALPPKQRTAVILRHIQALSYAEIARALECSEASARANVYQGLRRLRKELGEQGWTSTF